MRNSILVVSLMVLVGAIGAVADLTPRSAEGGIAPTSTAMVTGSTNTVVGGINEWTAAATATGVLIAAPAAAGVEARIVNVGTTTITLDPGTSIVGGASTTIEMSPFDVVELLSISATEWVDVNNTY